jgi:hypothetical protein
MVKPPFFAIAFLFSINCVGQLLAEFKQLRYEEDYSHLQNDSLKNWYQKTKFIPIKKSEKSYLSMGGDIRYQYLFIKNENWDPGAKDDNGFIMTRYLFHTDFHAGKRFRAFGELQSSFVNSRPFLAAVENGSLDLHQAFVDIAVKQSPKTSLTLRVGRQEMLYGSQRLISVKDAPNTRQSFDGIKSILITGKSKIDVFYSHYVENKVETFDDQFSSGTKFWGVYVSRQSVPILEHIDIYYLGIRKKESGFDDGIGKEIRHTFGGRISGSKKNWKYDLEGIYQSGKFNKGRIDAWSVSLGTSYLLSKGKLRPEVGLKTELISGDRNYDDNKLQTLNPLFPQGAYFGLAVGIGPVNLADFHPIFSIKPNKNTSLVIDHAFIWRYSRNDGIYRPNITLAYSGRGIQNKYIGGQSSCTLFYHPNPFINLVGGFSWFDAGPYLKEAGIGNNVLLAIGAVQLKF